MDINKDFVAWWDKNSLQYSRDSTHMSEFHMASVVWDAAVLVEREACAKKIRCEVPSD